MTDETRERTCIYCGVRGDHFRWCRAASVGSGLRPGDSLRPPPATEQAAWERDLDDLHVSMHNECECYGRGEDPQCKEKRDAIRAAVKKAIQEAERR